MAAIEPYQKQQAEQSLQRCQSILDDPKTTELQKKFAQKLLNRIQEKL